MSALSDLVKYAMTGDVMYHGEKYKRAKEAADELSDLLAQLDKAVAWHEGEDSPHAELEAELAGMRKRLEEIASAPRPPATKQAVLPQPPVYRVTQFSYWDTLMETLNGWTHKECPKFSQDRIKRGVPVSWNSDTKTLLVAIPEAEWANARWARTLTNMLQGLCAGSKIVFQEAALERRIQEGQP